MIADENRHRFFGNAAVLAAALSRERVEKVIDERYDVVAPLSEWGHVNGKHVQPIEQILTELALPSQFQ